MKSIRSLIMIAIGMMVFTATAHTAKLEQKQKTESVKVLTYQIDTVCVNDYQAFVFTSAPQSTIAANVERKKTNDPLTFLAIVPDVGWQYSKQRCSKIPYKEKLLENYDKDFVHITYRPGVPIRNDC